MTSTLRHLNPRADSVRGRLWRVGLSCALVALVLLVLSGSAGATGIANPVRYGNQPMSCPDPDVFNYGKAFVAACTSDFGQDNPDPAHHRMGRVAAAFPLYTSTDLKQWRFANYIFPPRHHPSQAISPLGNWPGGEYWAPEIHKLGGRWVAYFAASMRGMNPRRMAVFVAWTTDLFSGRWQSRLLHYLGEFNGVPGNGHEASGGLIDPSVARDPATGGLDIAYVKQPNQIWVGQLTPDGLHMLSGVHMVLQPTLAWEQTCVEGPVLWPYRGQLFMLYNAASTWDASYAVGVARRVNGVWQKSSTPLLHSGTKLLSTGIGAQPFLGPAPRRDLVLAFHVQVGKAIFSMEGRYLSFARLSMAGGTPTIVGAVPPTVFHRPILLSNDGRPRWVSAH